MDRLWTPWRYAYISGEAQTLDHNGGTPGVPAALAAWPPAGTHAGSNDKHCVFCNIIAAADYAIAEGMPCEQAERAIYLLERGEHCFLVLNAFPYSNGHLMAVPYAHHASLAELPLATAQELMLLQRRAERVLRKTYKPNGLNIGLNLGEAAGAGVAGHLHVHVLPRWLGDSNFMTVIGETRVLPEMLDESWRRLRAALAAEPFENETA